MKRSISYIISNGLCALLLCAVAHGQRVSLASMNDIGRSGGNQHSSQASVSADGRYIAFTSVASDLVPGDTNETSDVFVRDRIAGTTTLVSVNNAGQQGNGISSGSAMSDNGQVVAFGSIAPNMMPFNNNGYRNIFVRNLVLGTTSLVTISSDGSSSINNTVSDERPQLSADGRFIAFSSYASNLVANDTNNRADVFVRDLLTGVTTLASVNLNGASANSDSFKYALSADGRSVAFMSYASDLVVEKDVNALRDIFVRDLVSGTTRLVSVNLAGTKSGNSASYDPTISANGRFVAFTSAASDLTANDTNGLNISDVFVRDVIAQTTTLVSINRNGSAHSGPYGAGAATISSNGRVVVFYSGDSDMVEHDTNHRFDYFARDLSAGKTYWLSARVRHVLDYAAEAQNAEPPTISANGRFALFQIARSTLTFTHDVYVYDLGKGVLTLVNQNFSNTGSSEEGVKYPALSSDGCFIAFESKAQDLVPNMGNFYNIFVFRNYDRRRY